MDINNEDIVINVSKKCLIFLIPSLPNICEKINQKWIGDCDDISESWTITNKYQVVYANRIIFIIKVY